MLGSINGIRNGKQEETPRYVDRAARLLSEYPAAVVGSPASQSEVGEQECEGQMSESCESKAAVDLIPGVDGSVLTLPATTDGGFSVQHRSDGQDLGEATKRLAEAIQWALAQIEREAHDRAESDRTATKAGLEQLSAEVRQVERQLTDVRAEVQSAVQRESETCSSRAALDERSSQMESDLHAVRDHVLMLTDSRSALEEQAQNFSSRLAGMETRVTALAQTVDGLAKSLQSYAQAAGGVSAFCERVVESQASLNARLDEHDLTIEQLTAEAAHRRSLIDNLISSLRGLDGRRGSRQNVDRDVKVVMIDEREASIGGLVVDASDSGLGLRLETPVPFGSRLRLDVGGTQLVGEVVYCRKQGASHRVGLKSVREEKDRAEVEK